MRIETLLPDESGRNLADKIQQFKLSSQVGILVDKYHFLQSLKNGFSPTGDFQCKILLRVLWSEITEALPDLSCASQLEEVVFAHGFESDLECWRDLTNNSLYRTHLLLQPLALVNPSELARKLEGQPLDSVYFDFSKYSGDVEKFVFCLENELPGFRVRLLLSKTPLLRSDAEKPLTS